MPTNLPQRPALPGHRAVVPANRQVLTGADALDLNRLGALSPANSGSSANTFDTFEDRGAIFEDAASGLSGLSSLTSERSRASSFDTLSRTSSVESSFADRPGIANPPDTLSFSYPDQNLSSWLIFQNLAELACTENFDLHVNVASDLFESLSEITPEISSFEMNEALSDANTHVFQSTDNQAVLTMNLQDEPPPTWPEDTIFMGKKSMHTLEDGFSGEIGDNDIDLQIAIMERRSAAWQRLGVRDYSANFFADETGYGASRRELERVPVQTEVLSSRHGETKLRSVPLKTSISASVEGGEMVSNGADPGRRKFLIGLDSVAATQLHMSQTGVAAAPDDAKAQIVEQLHLVEGDQAIFVEQTSFHIDMTMAFCSENEVILNDSAKFYEMRMHQYWQEEGYLKGFDEDQYDILEDMQAVSQRLESAVEQTLEEAGITVHRKPWASESITKRFGNQRLSFFNSEPVKTHDGRTVLVTNDFEEDPSAISLSKDVVDRLKQDFTEFFRERSVDVRFLDPKASREILDMGGGIGCRVNGMRS